MQAQVEENLLLFLILSLGMLLYQEGCYMDDMLSLDAQKNIPSEKSDTQ